jgi:dienelactone hydrolase
MRLLFLVLVVCIAVVTTESHAAEPAKIELYVLQPTTLTDEQFLTGVRAGQPAAIAGELRLPAAATARVPAVVLVHGSGGATARDDRWSRELNDIGVATFLLDSFTGRGIASTVDDQSRLGELTMINDAYRALELLAKDPRIDSTRIGILGGSRGGVVALYASLTRFQRMHAPSGTAFAVYLSFYPPCSKTYIDDSEVVDRPIRLFHGTADDIAPIGQCRSYVERLRHAGKDVELTEYVGAQHGFDNPGVPLRRVVEGQPGVSPCALDESPVGRIVNRDTGLPFTRDDQCLKGRRTVGFDAGALAQATVAVKAILQRVFRLESVR